MSEPRTALIELLDEGGYEWEQVHALLDAIEAEARSQRDAELAAAVERMHTEAATGIGSLNYRIKVVEKAAVLALLRPPAAEPPEGGG